MDASGPDGVHWRSVASVEDFGFLGCDDASSLGKWFPTVQTNTTLESQCRTFLRRVGNSLRSDAASYPRDRHPLISAL
jgi:hypothetical protein